MGEFVVAGSLWFLAFAALVTIGIWRIEVNTRVLREVRLMLSYKQQSAEVPDGEASHEPMVATVDARSAPEPLPVPKYARHELQLGLPYVGFEDEPSSEPPARQSSGETLVSVLPPASEPPPAIEVRMVDSDDDDDDDDEFDHETIVAAARTVGVWDGKDDEAPMSDRPTIEMRASEHRMLGILRHADESAQAS